MIGLRLLQSLHRRTSLSTDLTRIDYEESDPDEDERGSRSPSTDSQQRLSSSTGLPSTDQTLQISDQLRQSSPSLFPSS